MQMIAALCDYQNRFGSKYYDKPYRSGMNKDLLKSCFAAHGYELVYHRLAEVAIRNCDLDCPVVYTSQEDYGYRYKSFIEDVVFGLEQSGTLLIPGYKYLRANNNKVYMEILRRQLLPQQYQVNGTVFGCFEELETILSSIKYPVVVKTAAGAGSHGVFKAESTDELIRIAKKISRTKFMKFELLDIARSMRHKGYRRESLNRGKFIVQEFFPGLTNDWKVLVYGDKYYTLRRDNRPGDFRASGSGRFSFDRNVDPILLEAAKEIKDTFNVPMISLDLALSGDRVILIEFQFVYFGTSTLEDSHFYFLYGKEGWSQVFEKSVLEFEYARSVVNYLEGKST